MAQSDSKLSVVSVIVPVFNDQVGIDACLSALGKQRYPTNLLEVIVVDNGSDIPIKVETGLAFNVQVVRCEKPGAYAARNAGLQVATGEILAFTDADCIPDPGWIELGVEALAVEAPCIVGGEVRFRSSSKPSAVELYQCMTGFAQRENIEERGFTVTANLLATREAFSKTGPFDTSLLSGGDLEWSRRASAKGYPVVFAPHAVVETLPRTSLRAAARQARRVAGGRKAMENDPERRVPGHIGPRPGAVDSVRWILGYSAMSWWDRLRVLGVAVILYVVRIAERARLVLGHQPERR